MDEVNKNLNFALVTSNSLMDKIPSWSSYQKIEEDQYIDLINYSKELILEDDNHKITFLVIAQGIDEKEEEEFEQLKSQKIEAENQKVYQKSLRDRSKSMLNSIYGI